MGIHKQALSSVAKDYVLLEKFYSSKENFSKPKCVSVSLSTWDKPESRSETPVGSCIVLSMVSSPMVKCLRTRPSAEATTHSIPSSVRPALENTSQELCSLIWSLLSSTRSEPAPTASCSTLNNRSPAKKMPPTTTPVDTTPW